MPHTCLVFHIFYVNTEVIFGSLWLAYRLFDGLLKDPREWKRKIMEKLAVEISIFKISRQTFFLMSEHVHDLPGFHSLPWSALSFSISFLSITIFFSSFCFSSFSLPFFLLFYTFFLLILLLFYFSSTSGLTCLMGGLLISGGAARWTQCGVSGAVSGGGSGCAVSWWEVWRLHHSRHPGHLPGIQLPHSLRPRPQPFQCFHRKLAFDASFIWCVIPLPLASREKMIICCVSHSLVRELNYGDGFGSKCYFSIAWRETSDVMQIGRKVGKAPSLLKSLLTFILPSDKEMKNDPKSLPVEPEPFTVCTRNFQAWRHMLCSFFIYCRVCHIVWCAQLSMS